MARLDARDGTCHYGFDRFRELINDHITSHDLVAMMNHEPGPTMQIDWADTLLQLADLTTGKPLKLHVFIAYLPYSGMVNAAYEAFLAWYNTAADRTRSRKPRDKAAVEAGVKVVIRSVIAVLQGSTFVDLIERQIHHFPGLDRHESMERARSLVPHDI